ncbi:MAG: hypothetical protein HY689_08100, partial [Chloroflexi bacterium]|nr:hypothetical protein [Chloroflexota bacterium]
MRIRVSVGPVLVAVAAFATAVACAPAGEPPAAASAASPPAAAGAPDVAQPKRGGTLILNENMQKPAMDLDQHRAISSDSLNVGGNLYLPILGEDTQNRGLNNIGYVAESWEQSPDGKTYTLKIRQMTTHKGKPFTAEDVAYNLERMRTQPNKLSLVRSGCLRAVVQKAAAPNPTTVVLTLQTPSASFISCLANPHILMIPKHVLEEIDGPGQGRAMQPEDVDGIGPFKFVKWVDGSMLEMERSDTYFRPGLPYLDRIQLVQLPDPSSAIAAFRT